jgi:hypothetical protein
MSHYMEHLPIFQATVCGDLQICLKFSQDFHLKFIKSDQ